MDRYEGYLAAIVLLLAILTFDQTSAAASQLFLDIGSAISILLILLLPVYIVSSVIRSRI